MEDKVIGHRYGFSEMMALAEAHEMHYVRTIVGQTHERNQGFNEVFEHFNRQNTEAGRPTRNRESVKAKWQKMTQKYNRDYAASMNTTGTEPVLDTMSPDHLRLRTPVRRAHFGHPCQSRGHKKGDSLISLQVYNAGAVHFCSSKCLSPTPIKSSAIQRPPQVFTDILKTAG
ncbi:hypothetical protein MBANPS3_012543 [Mucor bainieri]